MALEIVETPVTTVHGTSTRTPKSELGKNDFLLLLTKQLQNQDPLKPMDNMEFVAQMAQFSSLEQMTNMNKSIESFVSTASQGYKADAMSYLGMQVTATQADQSDPITGQVTAIRFEDGEAVFTVGGKDVKQSEINKVEFPTA